MKLDALLAGALDAPDQLVLRVALERDQLVTRLPGALRRALLD